MIEIARSLTLEADPKSGWELIFWVCDSFNFDTPFRAMLAEIAEALGQDPQTDLQLPPYEEYEDFIEGTLQFGAERLRIYFEYSLSILTLVSDKEAVLRDVAQRVQPRIVIA